ncbi:MAG: sensor histidine kinase, partial [Rubrivivax sp.]
MQSLPIFRYTVTEWVEEPVQVPELPDLPEPPAPPPPAKPASPAKQPSAATAAPAGPETASTAVPVPLSPASGAASAAPAPRNADNRTITIELPNSATREIVQAAIDEARRAAQDAVEAHREAQRAVEQAQREADLAARDAQTAARDALREARRALREAGLSGATRRVQKTRTVHWGDFLTDLALIWVLASVVIKATYKGRLQAEVKAAQATETAEAESL